MSVRNRIRRASLNAVAAEDASVVVDVVNLGIPLRRRDALLFGILCRFNKNAVRRAGGCTQKARYAFFQAVFVALQHVCTPKALFKLRALHRSEERRVGKECRSRWS